MEAINNDGYARLIPELIPATEASHYLALLLNELHWQQETLILFGKKTPTPRLTGWYGDIGAIYRYSGVTHWPQPWTEALTVLKQHVEHACQYHFNSVLANLYRNGRDTVGWHADNEKTLGPNPLIASLSLGATRTFKLRHIKTRDTVAIPLTSGSLLVMGGELQHHWHHCLPRTTKVDAPRINLTFRRIISNQRLLDEPREAK